MAVGVSDDERPDNRDHDLPEIVDDESIQEVIGLADYEHERKPAEKNGEGPLRRAVLRYPRHDGTAGKQDNCLHDLDRRELTRAENVAVAHYDMELKPAQVTMAIPMK